MSVPQASKADRAIGLDRPASGPAHLGGSVRFSGVSYSYPTGLQAVADLDLDVARGKSVGIVGPSGCGKSTLLALVAGLRRATVGTVSVDLDQSGRHPLTMVFQKDTVLPWLTVEQNVRLYSRFAKASRQETDARVRDLIKLAHLEGFEKAFPYQLSGGMRRRVAFLTSVAPLPQVLLLDEPFSALDEPSRVAIHQDVFRIVRELGITTMLVTHDIAEAVSLCDEVHVMTARPTQVSTTYPVHFGDQRDMLSLRESSEFLELYGSMWRKLREQIEVSRHEAK